MIKAEEQELVLSLVRISGRVVARNIPYEDFLTRDFGEGTYEWVDGRVIELSGVTSKHFDITRFLFFTLDLLLAQTGGGRTIENMTMRLPDQKRGRVPDLQVLLPHNLYRWQQTEVLGPADLVVEIVSEESVQRDYVEKLQEYVTGGVPEYWLIDPLRRQAQFYTLDEAGSAQPRLASDDGIYTSLVIPRLRLPVALLWQERLPLATEIVAFVQAMLAEDA